MVNGWWHALDRLYVSPRCARTIYHNAEVLSCVR